MSDQNQILLQTKLQRPRLPHNLVVRTRLLEMLNQVISHQITLICAPAGFGKTTLVCTWLEQMETDKSVAVVAKPAAWLSLDENDSDLNQYLRYFIAALRTIFKDACEETLGLLQAGLQAPQAILNTTLSNELAELPGDAILVLDDYHTLRGMEVHNLLIELARHWPKPLHLVLTSRIDPPIPLTGLRARGVLNEIRTQSLRFTPEETASFLSQTQLDLRSQDELRLLEERFEGWPAGLHLAALSLRSAGSQEAVLSVISGENPNLAGYLIDEVLSHQFPAINSFLIQTCILNRFCAPLCEAILGEVDPAWNVRTCLDWIERAELFITPLDEHREWYRYHHLFQEFLQQRLIAEMPPDQVRNLHRRASAWFEQHGLIDEALDHALAADDTDLAAHQMSAGLRDALNRQDRPTLERWLRLLPDEIIQRQPGLLMIKAWALEFLWRLNLQAQVLKQVEELLDSDDGASLQANDLQILRGQILVLRSQNAYFSTQNTRAIELSQQALALLPPMWKFVRGGAMLYQGMSMQASGQALAAEQLLLAEYESCRDKTDVYAMYLLSALCFNYLKTGQLEQCRQIAQVLLQGATQSGLAILKNWAEYFLGMVHYQWNELKSAAQHFTPIVESRYTATIIAMRDAVTGLVLIHQIQGENSEAWRLVESISQFDLEQSGREDELTRSLRTRLMLLQGDLERAGRWADTFTNPPLDRTLLWLEEPQVTRVRVLVARGADADLYLALQILDALYEIVERTHNTRFKIEILALRALVLDAQGDTGQADATLMQALDLVGPGGFIRVFADLGKPMQRMLSRFVSQDHMAETINRILAAFPEEIKPLVGSPRPALASITLAEPLTPRELDVLLLLREPVSIKVIAQKLGISHATANRHTANIYGKLGVNRRWDAVSRAEELHILPPG
jgi:LuxR family maltose regulon positive regulatory protein